MSGLLRTRHNSSVYHIIRLLGMFSTCYIMLIRAVLVLIMCSHEVESLRPNLFPASLLHGNIVNFEMLALWIKATLRLTKHLHVLHVAKDHVSVRSLGDLYLRL
jgi:hypothetical protein